MVIGQRVGNRSMKSFNTNALLRVSIGVQTETINERDVPFGKGCWAVTERVEGR